MFSFWSYVRVMFIKPGVRLNHPQRDGLFIFWTWSGGSIVYVGVIYAGRGDATYLITYRWSVLPVITGIPVTAIPVWNGRWRLTLRRSDMPTYVVPGKQYLAYIGTYVMIYTIWYDVETTDACVLPAACHT